MLIWLRRCAGWSVSLLFAYGKTCSLMTRLFCILQTGHQIHTMTENFCTAFLYYIYNRFLPDGSSGERSQASELECFEENVCKFQTYPVFFFTLDFSFSFFLTWVVWFGSRRFHLFWAESIVRWGRNRWSPRKTTWPPASRACLVSQQSCDPS